MDIAFLGGDGRSVRLAALFAADGHVVRAYGMEKAEGLPAAFCRASAAEAAGGAALAVLPLPVSPDGVLLTAPFAARPISCADAVRAVPPGTLLLAGKVCEGLASAAAERGVTLVDYFAREELVILNADATAEAAVGLLMQRRQRMLAGMRVLVVGFGRIGKLLALKLKALGAEVTASARKAADRAWIRALGIAGADTEHLADLGRYDAVINTVPAMVLDERRLRLLDRRCYCLDLASLPGGIDLEAARTLGLAAERAPGLPGKAVPESAAVFLRDTIYHILTERSVPIE